MKSLISKIWDSIKFGETVLIEYNSITISYLGVHHLIRWAKRKGYPVLVDDILDTFYMYKAQMGLVGIDTRIVDEVDVIKIGGRLRVGNVLARISVKEASVREQEYAKIWEKATKGKKVINPVLGIGKLFILSESKTECIDLINTLLSFVGNKQRISYYFINTDLMKITPCALPLLEELATTIVRINKHGKEFTIAVTKSINSEIDGVEIKI
ncbi:MAG: DUF257 family protein [Thermococcus sp.]|uniref:DUF257 family protein n=1 Tax=Thermococcus sp. TaxID=35749 RepID=UPI001D7C34C4|nr:DUF257 family protein [Thermococcus sp.]MBO8174170.1 DUF257 family protein [Thermococcus sp.]